MGVQEGGEAFRQLLVVHDGDDAPATEDDEGEERADTGVELVPLERVVEPLGLDL